MFEVIKQRLSKTKRTRNAIIRKCNKDIRKLTKALEKACDHPAEKIYFWQKKECAGMRGFIYDDSNSVEEEHLLGKIFKDYEDAYCCEKCNLTVTKSMDKKIFTQMQRKYLGENGNG